MDSGIQFSELLTYNEEEAKRWKQFFVRNPKALDLPLDIAGDVRKLVVHIFAVELFFANMLTGEPQKAAAGHDTQNLDEIFALGEQAAQLYKRFFSTAQPEDWKQIVEMGLLNRSFSKRKLVVQAFTHSMRHWAQISTYLRQQGLKQEWVHDFLFSSAME
jgi:uncharacterized damage-inducible protein DinB